MRKKRPLTEEERELFESTLGDAKPLDKAQRRPKKQISDPQNATVPVFTDQSQRPSPSQRKSGIDGNTADRLRRGLIEPQARLDLHGLSERDAHRALVTFLHGAAARKLRMVLIVTGKGNQGSSANEEGEFDLGLDMRMRGVLRLMTPRWLQEPGLAELIVDVRESHRKHGGAGAIYVYLRKQ